MIIISDEPIKLGGYGESEHFLHGLRFIASLIELRRGEMRCLKVKTSTGTFQLPQMQGQNLQKPVPIPPTRLSDSPNFQ
jgi:hypothetical protein